LSCGAQSGCALGVCRLRCGAGEVDRAGRCVEARTLALGNLHACALHDGGVVCWGPGSVGALGRGGYDGGRLPGFVSGLTGVASLSAGDNFNCALLLDGGVRCWGSNMVGQIGNTGTADQFVPAAVTLPTVQSLASGALHTCALQSDASVACWGSNLAGSVGSGSSQQVYRTPSPVAGAYVRIGAGSLGSWGVASNGSVFDWGMDNLRVLPSLTPVLMEQSDAGLRQVVCSGAHCCLIGLDSVLRCWGSGPNGELGYPSTAPDPGEPVRAVPGLGRARSVCTGARFTCAVLEDGGTVCFGDNTYGQLGTGNFTAISTPAPVSGLAAADQVACLYRSTCVTTVGGLFCWGDNTYGQLGAVAPPSSSSPIQVVLP
jgi:alpha-tubulin suppressor-like RCC1 family protein